MILDSDGKDFIRLPRKYLPLSGGRRHLPANGRKTGAGGEVGGGFRRNLCRTHRRTTDSRMRNAAYARGYLLTHRARQVRLRDFEEFDRIVAMDDTNYHNLYRLAPSREAGNRIYRMSEFFREHPKWTHVPDPYYEGHEGFELVLDMLEDGCRTLLDELEKR